jgi:hypothetical protein
LPPAAAAVVAADRRMTMTMSVRHLSLFDLTSGPDFPLMQHVDVLDDAGYANRMTILPDDRVAFVFSISTNISGVDTFKLYVRNLP